MTCCKYHSSKHYFAIDLGVPRFKTDLINLTLLLNSYVICVFRVSALVQYIPAEVLKVVELVYIARLYYSDACHYICCL